MSIDPHNTSHDTREHRRRRMRRHGRRAYIRSIYFLPSMATLGNAVCGFGAIYVAALDPTGPFTDRWTRMFAEAHFIAAAYLIFMAMLFDAIDGRLARFARHTTDFGGQLDSLADMISFGAAPAFLALQLFRTTVVDIPVFLSRAVWAAGAVYLACAAIRLARFNVSNEHGEQYHFSFLGLPSPGAAAAVAGFVLLQHKLAEADQPAWVQNIAHLCVWLMPLLVLATGLLMVSIVRYPHLVNRYLRGRRSIARLLSAAAVGLAVVVAHQYAIAIGALVYAVWGPTGWALVRFRRRGVAVVP